MQQLCTLVIVIARILKRVRRAVCLSIVTMITFVVLVTRYWFDELSLAVAVHYMFYMILVVVEQPEHIIAEGLHQPIGSCTVKQKVMTPTGMVS